MSIKTWIFTAYLNLFSLFLNCGVQAYENVLIVACELAIIGNGLAILVCLSAIQSETEKLKETIRNLK